MEGYWTVGDLAKLYGVRPSAVEYVLRSRCLVPDERMGITRLYGPRNKTQVGIFLAEVAAEVRGHRKAVE